MIFIVGPHNSGKSSLARFLTSLGFLHVETGDIVRQMYENEASPPEFCLWASVHEDRINCEIVKQTEEARSKVEKKESKLLDVVITGNRQLEGIYFVQEKVSPVEGTKHLIIYLEANHETLFARQLNRSDRPKIRTQEEFASLWEDDQRMGLLKIKEIADFVISTEAPKEEVKEKTKTLLTELGYQISRRERNIADPEPISLSKREIII